jgi:hypothetical protein
MAEGDAALGQVVGRQFQGHLVAGQDADVVLAHFPARVGDDHVAILQGHAVPRIRQHFVHRSAHFDEFFLGHDRVPPGVSGTGGSPAHEQAPSSARPRPLTHTLYRSRSRGLVRHAGACPVFMTQTKLAWVQAPPVRGSRAAEDAARERSQCVKALHGKATLQHSPAILPEMSPRRARSPAPRRTCRAGASAGLPAHEIPAIFVKKLRVAGVQSP